MTPRTVRDLAALAFLLALWVLPFLSLGRLA